jgi:hypothetical protein
VAGRALRAVGQRTPPPPIRDAVQASIDAMDWLTKADDGMVALALGYADRMQAAVELAEELATAYAEVRGDPGGVKRLQKLEASADATKMIGWPGQQLQGVLDRLGGSPQARKAMTSSQPVGGALGSLRKRAAATARGAGADAAEDVDTAPS